MSNVAKTKFVTATTKTGVNRNAGTITKQKLVSVGTPTGSELAINGLYSGQGTVSTVLGAIQEDVETGKSVTIMGPGSIVALESDGTATIAYGAQVVAVSGASLAASGRIASLPAAAATYYCVGRSVNPATVAASAAALCLVELCHPFPIVVT